jgi:N-acetylglucosaminyldiphosphoundecaprenol N-acetyl-beta-D-mannosaminyltransferase
MGVGGLFDYYSGSIPRAPLWMRKLGLEWVFRLSQEPQRLWQRYLVGNVVFLGRIAVDWLYDAVRKSRNVGSVK